MMHSGMGGAGWGAMRSMRQDRTITQHKLAKGTLRRGFGFARPYRGMLAVFLVVIIIDAVVGAANPLLTRAVINELTGHRPSTSVVVWLAFAIGGLAVFDAMLRLNFT